MRRGAAYQALELAELGLSESPEDSSLNELATRAAWLVGALDDAAEHASRWIRTGVDRDDLVEESRARRLAMRVAWDGGDDVAHTEQHRRLAALVDRMAAGEDRAAALADLAQANMLASRRAATIEYADRAIAEARAIGSQRVEAQALVERWSCRPDEAGELEVVAQVLAAVDRSEALGDHVTAARGLNNIVDSVAVEQRRTIIERMRTNAELAGFASLAAYSYAEHLADLASLSADRAELDRWLTHAWRWRRLGQCRRGNLWLNFYSALLEAEAGGAAGSAGDATGRNRTGARREERHVVRRPGRRRLQRRRTCSGCGRRGVGNVREVDQGEALPPPQRRRGRAACRRARRCRSANLRRDDSRGGTRRFVMGGGDGVPRVDSRTSLGGRGSRVASR